MSENPYVEANMYVLVDFLKLLLCGLGRSPERASTHNQIIIL